MRSLSLACLTATLSLSLTAAAASRAELTARLNAAHASNELTDSTLKPWHLAVSFDLLDKTGAVQEHGTIDEVWSAPDHFRLAIRSPSYTSTTTRLAGQEFRTSGTDTPPAILDTLLTNLEDPLPTAAEVDAADPTSQPLKFGATTLDCLMLASSHAAGPAPLGLYPTFCFVPGRTELRLFFNYGTQQILRNQIGMFQGKAVASKITILEGRLPVLQASIAQLSGATSADLDFVAATDQEQVALIPNVDEQLTRGSLLTKVAPEYPVEARQQHISGTVLLETTIARDGHPHSIRVIRSPSPLLSASALKAVQQWVYKPFLTNGVPTEIRTRITVNYNMGS